jgi:hypothetical protein
MIPMRIAVPSFCLPQEAFHLARKKPIQGQEEQ